jgi:hypothetical protein
MSVPAGVVARHGGCADFVEDGLRGGRGEEVGAHALGHNLSGDVDHVGVAHSATIDDVSHLHAAWAHLGWTSTAKMLTCGLHVGKDAGGHR